MFFSLKSLRIACMLQAVTAGIVAAQIEPATGIRQNTPAVHAFVHARIVSAPGKIIESGTLVIRNGLIEAAGAGVKVPSDARVWDLAGMTMYPGLFDSYSDIGVPKKPQPSSGGDQQVPPPPKAPENRGARHWSDNVLASQNADELFMPDSKAAEKLRAMGITTALVVPQYGIFHGTSAVMNVGDGTASQQLVKARVAQHVTFETSFGDNYPNSLMGAIAMIRQTFLDAQWHRSAMLAAAQSPNEPRPEFIADLAALEDAVQRKQPVVFETADEIMLLRSSRIAQEFSLQAMVRGSGYEYRRLDAVKQTGLTVILPVNFPEAPSVQTPEDALTVGLEELRAWDEAPENPAKLHAAGIPFSFTTATLKDPAGFLGNIRKAVERGLPADAALAALTTVPASLFGVEKKAGSLEPGKMANFVITDGDLFSKKTKIRETWVSGKRYEVKPKGEYDPRGTWKALLRNAPVDTLTLVLKGEADAVQVSVKAKGKEIKPPSSSYSDLRVSLSVPLDSLGGKGFMRMTGETMGEGIIGTGELPDGAVFQWSAARTAPFVPEPDTSKIKPILMASFGPVYPPGAFGRAQVPEQPAKVFVRGATVWTSGPAGTIPNCDLLMEKGKIVKVGAGLPAPADAVVIDGAGKHVTPGIIDCHSHSAAAGSVNETGQGITAEVRIGDVVDPDDISVYRELAGGLTVANVLHGSANPIGGQNQVIKLRWGTLPEQMKFEDAMPGIKFALGENPKQSNWGDKYTTRYPQTREGVEQIIRDEFKAALDYEQSWKDFDSGKRKIPPRRDLQAEALLEILKGKRLVHSHSYRQDEILMLIRVADEFGFKVATFQHVLEGYKVADKMAEMGTGGSTFSDWWAYKFEVYDAIPYNGALMHDAGVVVSFNSDSDEMARRLNTEAAKAVKYGGLSQDEALKFVTINPARQLRIDKRVGSLEPGKDADFVVWSDNPLSTYAACEQTWIDGRKYFDRAEDAALNAEVQKERAALIQKALSAKPEVGPAGAGAPPKGYDEHYSCRDNEGGR